MHDGYPLRRATTREHLGALAWAERYRRARFTLAEFPAVAAPVADKSDAFENAIVGQVNPGELPRQLFELLQRSALDADFELLCAQGYVVDFYRNDPDEVHRLHWGDGD